MKVRQIPCASPAAISIRLGDCAADLMLIFLDSSQGDVEECTPYDFFNPPSLTNANAISARAMKNRHLLSSLTNAQGFNNPPLDSAAHLAPCFAPASIYTPGVST